MVIYHVRKFLELQIKLRVNLRLLVNFLTGLLILLFLNLSAGLKNKPTFSFYDIVVLVFFFA